jgi:hypothetical protein
VNEELRERWKMEVTDSTFEDMIDQLEKSSGDYGIRNDLYRIRFS